MRGIQVKGLKKYFRIVRRKPGIFSAMSSFIRPVSDTVKAVDGITFSIKSGELVGFIGPNGAGKTTTLKCLSGLLYPDGGEVNIEGFNPSERKYPYLKKISLITGQRNQLIWDLPGIETLRLNKSIYDIENNEFEKRLRFLTSVLKLENIINIAPRQLSQGQRMRMELAASLLHEPEILFLDEPTLGLDVMMQSELRDFIKEYNRTKRATVILTSHYMNDVRKICNRVIVINKGKIIYDGSLLGLTRKFSDYKIFTAEFSREANLAYLAKYCRLKRAEGSIYEFTVKRNNVNLVAGILLKKYKVEDLNITEPDIEEIIKLVFADGGK